MGCAQGLLLWGDVIFFFLFVPLFGPTCTKSSLHADKFVVLQSISSYLFLFFSFLDPVPFSYPRSFFSLSHCARNSQLCPLSWCVLCVWVGVVCGVGAPKNRAKPNYKPWRRVMTRREKIWQRHIGTGTNTEENMAKTCLVMGPSKKERKKSKT